jgi:hypothetical protein
MSGNLEMNFEDSSSPAFTSLGPNTTYSNASPGGMSLPMNMWLENISMPLKKASSSKMNNSGFESSP